MSNTAIWVEKFSIEGYKIRSIFESHIFELFDNSVLRLLTKYNNQGHRNKYDIIDHGHKRKYFYVFFQRPINFGA